jgi:hypothetical protein
MPDSREVKMRGLARVARNELMTARSELAKTQKRVDTALRMVDKVLSPDTTDGEVDVIANHLEGHRGVSPVAHHAQLVDIVETVLDLALKGVRPPGRPPG